jgi:hypothetical protein
VEILRSHPGWAFSILAYCNFKITLEALWNRDGSFQTHARPSRTEADLLDRDEIR